MQKYVGSAWFYLSLPLHLCILGSSCRSDSTEHMFGRCHCSYGACGCWWGSGNQPIREATVCPGLAPYGVCFSEQVLETTEAQLKQLSNICKWFHEWIHGPKGTDYWTKWNDRAWTKQKVIESPYVYYYCCSKSRKREENRLHVDYTKHLEIWVMSPVWDHHQSET